MAVEYKYNPYSPKYMTSKPLNPLSDTQNTIKSLESQQENLEKRLEAIGGGPDKRNFLEKLFNLPEGQNAIMDIIEVVNRPLETVKGFVSGLVNEEEDPLKEAARGFTGERGMTSFSETILQNATNLNEDNMSGVSKFFIDFAADIVLDPLTYLPAGIFASAVKKVLKTGSVKVKIVDAVVDSVNSASRTLAVSKLKNAAGEFTEEALEAQTRIVTKKAFKKKLAAAKKTKTALKKGKKKLAPGGLAEIDTNNHLARELKQTAEELGVNPDNFFVLNEGEQIIPGTTRKVKDSAIYYAVDEDNVVRLTRGETKKIERAAGSFGTNTKLDFKDIDDVSRGIPLKKGQKPNLGRQFLEDIKDIQIKSPVTKRKIRLVNYIKKNQKSNLLELIRDPKLYVTKEGFEQVGETVKRLFFDDLALSGVGHISIRTSFGKVITLTTESAKKYFKFTASVGSRSAGRGAIKFDALANSFRKLGHTADLVKVGKKFKLKVKPSMVELDDLKQFADDIIAQKKIVRRKGIEGTLLDYAIDNDTGEILFDFSTKNLDKQSLVSNITLREPGTDRILEGVELAKIDETDVVVKELVQGQVPRFEEFSLLSRIAGLEDVPLKHRINIPYVTPAAKFLKESFEGLSKAFNFRRGASRENLILLNRIGGQKNLLLQAETKKLGELLKQTRKIGGETAEKAIYLISESGAKLTPKGVRNAIRRKAPSDIFKDISVAIAEGRPEVFLSEFASKKHQDDFLNELNRLYRNAAGIKDEAIQAFKIKQVNESFQLGFTGQFDDAFFKKNFSKILGTEGMSLKTLNYGPLKLDKEVIDFWRQNPELVQGYMGVKERLRKMLVTELGYYNMADILGGPGSYMPHMLTEEMLKGKQKHLPAVLNEFQTPSANMLKRRTLDATTAEINRYHKNFYNMGDVFDMDLQRGFETTIQNAADLHEQSQVFDMLLKSSDANGKSFIQVVPNNKVAAAGLGGDFKILKNGRFADEFPKIFDGLTPRSKEIFEAYMQRKGFVKGKTAQAVNRTMYNYLRNLEKAYNELPKFLKRYDKFTNLWKSITLLTPGYHSKNFLGNGTNSYLAGMGIGSQLKYISSSFMDKLKYNRVGKTIAKIDPKDIRKTLGTKRINELAFKGIPIERIDMFDVDDLIKLGVNPKDARAYKRMYNYFDSGSSQSHKGLRDLEAVKLKNKNGGSLTSEAIRFNYNAAEAADDLQRYGLYRWQYDKSYKKAIKSGLNTTEAGIKAQGDAAIKVAEALFDYSHLTPFEREYMKRLFPFYTFFKNNIGFQTKTLVSRPKQVARIGRTYNNYVTNIAGMEVDELPSYMAENMWLPIPLQVKRNDKDAIAFLKTNLPVSDFAQFVEDPLREGANFITTPIKLLGELAMNREVFTGLPLDRPMENLEKGVLKGIRDQKGNLTLPTHKLQKIAQDLGLRVPMNYLSVLLDLADTVTGAQDFGEGTADFMQRMGLVGVQEKERLELSNLYQQLELLRDKRGLYEAQSGQRLPQLKDIEEEELGLPPGLDEYLKGLR